MNDSMQMMCIAYDTYGHAEQCLRNKLPPNQSTVFLSNSAS